MTTKKGAKSPEIQSLVRDIEFNTRELQCCIIGKMKCITQEVRTQVNFLLHDKDALVNSTSESHIAQRKLLDEARLSLYKKSEPLTEKRATLESSYRALQASDTDRDGVERALQENTKAVNDFLSASQENDRALQEHDSAFEQLAIFREEHKKVGQIHDLVSKLHPHVMNICFNTKKLSENNSQMQSQILNLESSTKSLLDGNRELTNDELVNQCVLIEVLRNKFFEGRSGTTHECNEFRSQNSIPIMQEEMANSSQIMSWVLGEYNKACIEWDKALSLLQRVTENNTEAYERNIQVFPTFNRALKLYQNILFSGLKTEENTNEDNEDCCICLSEKKRGQKVIKWTKCLHSFHDQCVLQWMRGYSSCPLCREALPE